MKRMFQVLVVGLAYLLLGFAVIAAIYLLPEEKNLLPEKFEPSTSEDFILRGVYVLKEPNSPSWFKSDAIITSGVSHDFVLLVNPLLKGDRVYPQEGLLGGVKEGWFFFIDQLKKVDDPIYKIKVDAKVYKYLAGERKFDLSEEGGLYPYLWSPKTGAGGERIYLNNDVLTVSDNAGDNYWIRREDLVLINPFH